MTGRRHAKPPYPVCEPGTCPVCDPMRGIESTGARLSAAELIAWDRYAAAVLAELIRAAGAMASREVLVLYAAKWADSMLAERRNRCAG